MTRRTIWDNDNAASDERFRRREAANDRYLDLLDRKQDACDALIGQLCREGKTVYYINLLPLQRGRIKEGSRGDLIAYLIRNRYV